MTIAIKRKFMIATANPSLIMITLHLQELFPITHFMDLEVPSRSILKIGLKSKSKYAVLICVVNNSDRPERVKS